MYSRVLRFAPSPNGYLHLGHAYSALLNSDMARELGGRLLLRIEDIDAERCRPEYEGAIYEDLGWLGICLAGAGAPPERAFCRLRDGDRGARSGGPALPELRKPPRTCRAGGGARSSRRLAARSGWRADLSRTRTQIVGSRMSASARGRRTVRVAARHG